MEASKTKHPISYYTSTYGDTNAVKDNLFSLRLFDKTVKVLKKAASAFQCAQKDIRECEEGRNYQINTIETYKSAIIQESKDTNPVPSLHSFGIAVDINAKTNPISETELITDIPQCVVEAFERYGFVWGGKWEARKHAMHFEWRK